MLRFTFRGLFVNIFDAKSSRIVNMGGEGLAQRGVYHYFRNLPRPVTPESAERSIEEVDKIAVYCRFTGLKDRCLAFTHFNRPFPMGDPSSTDKVILTGQITQQQVQDNLAEFLHPLLQRLYEKFNFYELLFDYVAEELQRLRRGL